MNSHQYGAFIADLQRFRPLVVVVLTLLVLIPSLNQMVTQNLSVLVVLVRLAESMFVVNIVVALVSSVLRRYARIQSRQAMAEEPEQELSA